MENEFNKYQMNMYGYNKPYENNQMMEMPPYMYGNCMKGNMMMNGCCDKMENMPMYNMNMGRGDYNMYMMPHQHAKMEPIETMCGKVYKTLIFYVDQSVGKIVIENGGMMPKYLPKERFNKEMNNLMVKVLEKEKEIKKLVVIDREETEESNEERAFCPYCNGMLKSTLEILLVTQLVRGGCLFCV